MTYKQYDLKLCDLLDAFLSDYGLRVPREIKFVIEHIIPEKGSRFFGEDWWALDGQSLTPVRELTEKVLSYCRLVPFIHLQDQSLMETKRGMGRDIEILVCKACDAVIDKPNIYPPLWDKLCKQMGPDVVPVPNHQAAAS